MSAKHTPGPWFLANPTRIESTYGDDYEVSVCAESGGGRITRVVAEDTDADHTEANAHLIAAAPMLLETLRAAANDVELAANIADARGSHDTARELWSHAKIYRAAIAKAEGK
jgi:hypothetical protein